MALIGWLAISSAVTAAACLVGVVLTRARLRPYVAVDAARYPPIQHALATIAGLTESTVHEGNAATVFQDDAIYPAMLADIAAARHCVHLETFVWCAGRLERQFVDALVERAGAGVEVRVLLDAVGGSRASSTALQRMRAAGVKLASYCAPRWWNWRRFNERTHRKLLVIDGRVGYAFGHGIGDEWLDGGELPRWRDTGVRLEGPVVHPLQSVFAQNWMEETRSLPDGVECFPETERRGTVTAHVVSSASGDAVSSVAMLYSLAIAAARREVLIQNPYFAPNRGLIELFAAMVRRGVAVHLMVPGKHTDSPFVRHAGCHLYDSLLEAGVHVYEFEPTLLHQKVVVVDGIWSHVGSTNFDPRSLALNEEVGVGMLDARVAAELRAAFARDLRGCRELTLETWRSRPVYSRAYEAFAYLLHAQL